jgi:hypothetical protein
MLPGWFVSILGLTGVLNSPEEDVGQLFVATMLYIF